MARPDRLLTSALVLLSVVLLAAAAMAVSVIVGENLALREYGDQPPGGGYGTIFGTLLLILLLVPGLAAVAGWRLRRGQPRSAAVATGLGGGLMALPALAVAGGDWRTALVGLPGLLVLVLAVAAVVGGSRSGSVAR